MDQNYEKIISLFSWEKGSSASIPNSPGVLGSHGSSCPLYLQCPAPSEYWLSSLSCLPSLFLLVPSLSTVCRHTTQTHFFVVYKQYSHNLLGVGDCNSYLGISARGGPGGRRSELFYRNIIQHCSQLKTNVRPPILRPQSFPHFLSKIGISLCPPHPILLKPGFLQNIFCCCYFICLFFYCSCESFFQLY